MTGTRDHISGQIGPNEAFKNELLALVPFLRAFARSLSGRTEGADDLAQETLVKAWQSRESFAAGTNMKAWLFTILRNQFYSERRRAWRQTPWDADAAERIRKQWRTDLGGGAFGHRARIEGVAGRTARGAHSRWRGRLCLRRSGPDQQLCRRHGQKPRRACAKSIARAA